MTILSRRNMLKAALAGAGAFAGTRIAGSRLFGVASAATAKPTSVVCIYLNGGFNAIFTGANAFLRREGSNFGVNNGNITNLGGGLMIDTTLANAIPESLRGKVASVGVRHGTSSHEDAQTALFMSRTGSAPLTLANAIGGDGAIKAAVIGDDRLPNDQRPAPVGAVSLQPVRDMATTLEVIAGIQNPPANAVDRGGATKGLVSAQAMSKAAFAKNTKSLSTVDQGLTSAVSSLTKPIQPFDQAAFSTAYDLQGTNINNFKSKLAAAELMVLSGSNFVIAQDGGWDTHGDSDGSDVRNKVTSYVGPALTTLLQRLVIDQANERNVIVTIFGDFHRSLEGSDHAAGVSALVIGNTVKTGTTGLTDVDVSLKAGTPGIDGLWQFLGAAAKVDTNPFGANPHANLLG